VFSYLGSSAAGRLSRDDMAPTLVTRTYLEMSSRSELRPASLDGPLPQVDRLEDCSVDLFRFLYREVGQAHRWTDRLLWSDQRVREHLDTAGVSLWLMSWEEKPAGYFELRQHEDHSVEIAYFGLLPDFIGRGWGRYLLTRAVESAWQLEPSRVWLHTCTLDHPAALPNYLKRGFRPTREEVYELSG
jgi:GNAT superfamily N-acetyltransferase